MEYQKKTSKTEEEIFKGNDEVLHELADLREYLDGLKKFQDRMYRHYLDEKQTYRETDVLSKKEYIKKYKDFLIDKLIEESKSEGQG